MSPEHDEHHTREPHDSAAQLEQAMRTNRILLGMLVIILVAAAGLGGWLMGRERPAAPAHAHGPDAHHNCSWDLPPRGIAIVRSIRCGHGTPIVDAHCDEGHGIKRFIIELIQQNATDEDIKAALLRRYGEKGLTGRDW